MGLLTVGVTHLVQLALIVAACALRANAFAFETMYNANAPDGTTPFELIDFMSEEGSSKFGSGGRALLGATPVEATEMQKPASLIRCSNQTRCLSPILQIKKKYKLYFCKHKNHGVRFYYLAREALLLHPHVILTETPEEAEYIIYLPVSADWSKTECNNPAYMNKTIIMDEGDYPSLFEPSRPELQRIHALYPKLAERKTYYHLYFKRSCVKRQAGEFLKYMNYFEEKRDIFPMTYTIMESYVKPDFNLVDKRDYELVCTLRGSKQDPARKRVQDWVQEYATTRKLGKYIGGQVNHASRTTIDGNYFGSLHRAQIVVTCNPSHWEGDFRFMETMASGALVLVDKMATPRPFALLHNKHVVYYDNTNKTAFFEALDFYRANKQQMRRVAVNGYLHSMYHHRAANLMDYVLKTLEHREEVEAYIRDKRSASAIDSFRPVTEQDILHLDPSTESGLQATHKNTGYDMKRFILSEMKMARVQGNKNQLMNRPPPLAQATPTNKGKGNKMAAPVEAGVVAGDGSSSESLHAEHHRLVRGALLGFERRR